MSETQTLDAGDEAPDPCEAVAERQLSMLAELGEIGMRIARALGERAVSPPPADPEGSPAGGPLDAFAKVSRAIRLTLALEARTAKNLRDLRAGILVARDERRRKAALAAAEAARLGVEARHARVRELVCEAIEAEAADIRSLFELEACLDERLEEDEAYDRLPDLPLKQTVERICADLCLSPDWSRWDGEGWKAKEPFSRPPSSWFHLPRTKTIPFQARKDHLASFHPAWELPPLQDPEHDPAASP